MRLRGVDIRPCGKPDRRSRLRELAPARPALQIVWASIWPALAGAAILQGMGLLMESAGSWGSPGQFPWVLVLAWAAMVGFHTILGYALGTVLPVLAAAPLAVLVSYTWIGFTWSMPYMPLRYLSGLAISGCCTVDADLAPAAPLAVLVFSVGGALAIGALMTVRYRTVRRTILVVCAAALVVGVTTSSSLYIAKDLGPYPSPQRAAAEQKCTHAGTVEICLFPEQRWAPSADVVDVVSGALKQLRAAGIDTPRRVSATVLDTRPGTIDLVYRRDFDADTIVHSLSTSITPQAKDGVSCPRDEKDPTQSLFVMYVTQSALYRLATGKPDLEARSNPQVDHAAARLVTATPALRSRWINSALRALGDCSLPLPKPSDIDGR
ncbi:MAG: hypothetical protein J0I50_05115 [Microbacterium sp.]|uniref:DUF7224 domain-containing protein n=1 Tax=Microbacterium sp. TaxID=51671 RepID=UPI001AC698D5|nr:hypothetical protein [Microbacterium sp.]MBN9153060.1 hypothetical protein [Microbacterium sp.]MBN9171255.1 hypothetical protein [Microbacterium sp.]